MAGRQPYDVEYRIRRSDGTYGWFKTRGTPIRDSEGTIVKWFGTCTDITDRKRAEQVLKEHEAELRQARDLLEVKVMERTKELRRSEAYLEEAQRLSKTGSFGWNVPSGEIYWSEETFRILEYSHDTKPGLELVQKRTHPEDRVRVHELIDRTSRNAEDFDLEHRLLMPDGSVKHVHVVGHLLETGQPGKTELVGAITDITERKHAEAALRQTEAYLEEAQRLTHTGSWAWNVARRENVHLVAGTVSVVWARSRKQFSILRNSVCSVFIPRTGLHSMKRSNERFVKDQISKLTFALFSQTARPSITARSVTPFSVLPAS